MTVVLDTTTTAMFGGHGRIRTSCQEGGALQAPDSTSYPYLHDPNFGAGVENRTPRSLEWKSSVRPLHLYTCVTC